MNGIDFVRSRKETAKILSISLATLARLEKAGQMPPRIKSATAAMVMRIQLLKNSKLPER